MFEISQEKTVCSLNFLNNIEKPFYDGKADSEC